jgi:hypothetical protein
MEGRFWIYMVMPILLLLQEGSVFPYYLLLIWCCFAVGNNG